MINTEAIYSDATEMFLTPNEPMEYDRVYIRCRVAKDDIDKIELIINETPISMYKKSTERLFDIYEGVFSIGKEKVLYYFRIQKDNEVLYYNNSGIPSERNDMYYSFRLFPGFRTPNWAKGAVIYQIYVDRFCNGDSTNDVEDREYAYIGEHVSAVRDWDKYPATMGVREFYGGDLKGILKKLDYLQDLGIEVIYLNPVFVSPSNHKYDTQDYDYIDPHFTVIKKDGGEVLAEGDLCNARATKYMKRVVDKENLEASNEFFARFVDEVHRRGMKIILDGVFNHCGSFNKWLDREQIYESSDEYEKGAFIAEDSPYHTFFKFFQDGTWPYNTHYNGWWGHDTLPKLNYEESDKLFTYIMRIAKKWVSPPYNIDGWRLDVAADLGYSQEYNHKFWQAFRRSVKEANPEALILAEHYGDAESWLQGNEWDTVMNYDAFMEPVSWFLTGMEKHSDVFRPDLCGNVEEFLSCMRERDMQLGTPSMMVAMNELSNHDHSRFLTRTNHMIGRVATVGAEAANRDVDRSSMMAAVVLQMTWFGAPTVYYGDEAGMCGWTDPDNRRTYPWGSEDKDMILCHKEMIRIHKDYKAIRTGSIIGLRSKDNLLCYGRFDGEDQLIILIQVGGEDREVEVPVWKTGLTDGDIIVKLASTDQDGFHLNTEIIPVTNNHAKVRIRANGTAVYKNFANP